MEPRPTWDEQVELPEELSMTPALLGEESYRIASPSLSRSKHMEYVLQLFKKSLYTEENFVSWKQQHPP